VSETGWVQKSFLSSWIFAKFITNFLPSFKGHWGLITRENMTIELMFYNWSSKYQYNNNFRSIIDIHLYGNFFTPPSIKVL